MSPSETSHEKAQNNERSISKIGQTLFADPDDTESRYDHPTSVKDSTFRRLWSHTRIKAKAIPWLRDHKRHIAAGGAVFVVLLIVLMLLLRLFASGSDGGGIRLRDDMEAQQRAAEARLWRDLRLSSGDSPEFVDVCSERDNCRKEMSDLVGLACTAKYETVARSSSLQAKAQTVRDVVSSLVRSMSSGALEADPLWRTSDTEALNRLSATVAQITDKDTCAHF